MVRDISTRTKYQEKRSYIETKLTSQADVFQIYLDFRGRTTNCSLKIKIYGKISAFLSQMVSSPLGQKLNS